MPETPNTQRVTTRVPPNVYDTLARAAALSGATMNQFIVQSALEKARPIIEGEHFIKLTVRSAKVFLDALENPPDPNAALREAVHRYQDTPDETED